MKIKKSQIIIVIAALVAVVILFQLPKSVVNTKNDAEDVSDRGENTMPSAESPVAENELTADSIVKGFSSSKKLFNNKAFTTTFADSIAKVYLKQEQYDSAASVYSSLAIKSEAEDKIWEAGKAYYNAYTVAEDESNKAALYTKALKTLEKVISEQPDIEEAKIKKALLLVDGRTPMQGIMMLKQILEEDPDNQEVLIQLGRLSYQTGQYEKAIERLERLVEVAPDNKDAKFMLALSYKEINEKKSAKKLLKELKQQENDPETITIINGYLEEL